MPYQIWEGIYPSFSHLNIQQDAFSSAFYRAHIEQKMHKLMSSQINQDDYLLPGILERLLTCEGDVSVLDFGGGAGESYTALSAQTQQRANLTYDIVDNADIIALGKRIFAQHSQVNFYPSLADLNSSCYDILHFGSSLQYIDDWQGLMTRLIQVKPKLIILDDVFTGDIPTYVTVQKIYTVEAGFEFLNFEQIQTYFSQHGYGLLLKTPFIPLVQGKRQFYDMRNFPQEYRIPHAFNLIFCRGLGVQA